MAGSDRPPDIAYQGGVDWIRRCAIAVNWLLARVAGLLETVASLGGSLADYLLVADAEKLTGWGAYFDGAGSQAISAATRTQVTINSAATIVTQKPADVATFWDNSTNTITGREGDAIVVKVQCIFTPSDATASMALFDVDIGGSIGIVEYHTFTIALGSGVAHYLSWTFVAYTLDTWEANGGKIYITTDGPGALTSKRVVIARVHKAH